MERPCLQRTDAAAAKKARNPGKIDWTLSR